MDVEDEADFLDPLDVENFPTLLIGKGDRALFWGAIAPQATTLERMVRTLAQDVDHPGLSQPDLAALFTRIRKEKLLASVPTRLPQG
jgi:hypothetical protein